MSTNPFDLTEPPAPPKISKCRAMGLAIWDQLKADSDPAAAELPESTQVRLEAFTREVRNATIEQVARGIERAYSKFNATINTDILKLKE